MIIFINCSSAEQAILQIHLLYSLPYNAENVYLGVRSEAEKAAAAADRYSESCFEELKHANQWRYGSSMGASERTMDALYNEGNEIENYVDDMLDDKDTSNAAAADGQSASTLQTQDPSFQSLHPSPNPSNVSTPRRSTGKIYTQKSYCFRFASNFKSIEISRALQFSLRTYIAVERS